MSIIHVREPPLPYPLYLIAPMLGLGYLALVFVLCRTLESIPLMHNPTFCGATPQCRWTLDIALLGSDHPFPSYHNFSMEESHSRESTRNSRKQMRSCNNCYRRKVRCGSLSKEPCSACRLRTNPPGGWVPTGFGYPWVGLAPEWVPNGWILYF